MTSEIIKNFIKYILPILSIIYLFEKGWPLNNDNPYSFIFVLVITIILIIIFIFLIFYIGKFFLGEYDDYINDKFDPMLEKLFNIFKKK